MNNTFVDLDTGEILDVPFTKQEQIDFDLRKFEYAAGARDRKALEIRTERNGKIAACDWRMLTDSPNSAGWKVYRQALRDVTKQTGFPDGVTWPVEP